MGVSGCHLQQLIWPMVMVLVGCQIDDSYPDENLCPVVVEGASASSMVGTNYAAADQNKRE